MEVVYTMKLVKYVNIVLPHLSVMTDFIARRKTDATEEVIAWHQEMHVTMDLHAQGMTVLKELMGQYVTILFFRDTA